MPNFARQFPVEGTILDFRFSLIHYPGGVRYWVTATCEQAYVASFYFEKNKQGVWKLSDRYNTAPAWVYTLESQLAAAIYSHKPPGEI